MKQIYKILIIAVSSTIALMVFPCEFDFLLEDQAGMSQNVKPGKTINIEQGKTYTLTVIFKEDHGNCKVSADETYFFLDDEKWKSSKDYLPLVMTEQTGWNQFASRSWEKQIVFTADKGSQSQLMVLRECPKGGFDEVLNFQIN